MTNFNQTFIEMMAVWPATRVISSDLEIVGSHHLQKNCCISTIIWPIFTKLSLNYSTEASSQNAISADLENVGQVHHLQKSLQVGYYMINFNQTHQNDAAETDNKSMTLEMWVNVTFHEE